MTEAEAREAGHDVEVHKHSLAGNGRAMILGETDGLVKIVAAKDGPILGFHMVGPWASELLHEGYLAVNWEALPERRRPPDPRPPEPLRGDRRNHDHLLRPFPARLRQTAEKRQRRRHRETCDVERRVGRHDAQAGRDGDRGHSATGSSRSATTVEFDDPLFEVSTDKVDSEIPSPYDGVIAEILVPAGETVPVGTPLVRITAVRRPARWSNRLPSASHTVAAAGGPALGDPAAPQMGGSEGPADEDPNFGAPDRRRPRHHDAQARRDGHRGHDRLLAEAGRRHRRVGRPAVRGVHRQGRLGDPQPVRRGAAGDPGPAGETVPVGTPLARIGEAGAAAAGPRGVPP